jgi:DNA topoisomerase-1
VLQKCEDTIKACLDPLKRKIGKVYSIDETHELVFGKSGAMIKVKGEMIVSYKPLKHGLEIDFEKLERGEYKLSDLTEMPLPSLGIYNGEDVFIKTGPFGPYVSCGKKTVSLKDKTCDLRKITFDMAKGLLLEHKSKEGPELILRELDEFTSVRKSKFGLYVFYKTVKMKKPKFINLKSCPYDVLDRNISDASLLIWIHTQI